MIHPFDVQAENPTEMLKPASCGIRLGGDVIYWDTEEDGTPVKRERTLKEGEELILKKNSIVYVTLEPMLRMPDYIAARFNLTIRDIYRGLLVGTGPLVDPGFTGRLSLPLHNLTFTDYPIRGGEPLVWMEFTKLSPNERWEGSGNQGQRVANYVQFPKRKRDRRTVQDYLYYATNGPVTSSIPPLVERTSKAAEDAQKQAGRQQRNFSWAIAAGLVTIVIGIAAMLISVYALIGDTNTERQSLEQEVKSLSRQVTELHQESKRRASPRPAD
jgi:deoxycytidine triphosphate deaminase/cell division protein FtsL